MRRLFLAAGAVFLTTSCSSEFALPTAPSMGALSDSGGSAGQSVPLSWSPYLNVHSTGEALDAYREVFTKMSQNGTLRGIRLETLPHENFNNVVIDMARQVSGLDILFLINNYYLTTDGDIERVIDDAIRRFPDIRYFQIGNEITTIIPAGDPQISTREYMDYLQRAYDHILANYPYVTLLSQSTLGAGDYGARELEIMADLGLAGMNPARVIVGINAYTYTAVSSTANVLNGRLRRYRVWITETGIPDPNRHVDFVRHEYPKLRNSLRPERIYWYTLFNGDGGVSPPDSSDFGLIKYPSRYPDYWKSPLLKALMREE